MRRCSTACPLMLVCLPCLALAGEGFVPPRSPGPTFYVIRSINKEKGEIDLVAMTALLVEPLNPKSFKTKLKPFDMTWYVDQHVAHTAAGKRIESSKVWDMVKVGQAVAVALTDRGIDPRYRKLFKPDTIIITFPTPGK